MRRQDRRCVCAISSRASSRTSSSSSPSRRRAAPCSRTAGSPPRRSRSVGRAASRVGGVDRQRDARARPLDGARARRDLRRRARAARRRALQRRVTIAGGVKANVVAAEGRRRASACVPPPAISIRATPSTRSAALAPARRSQRAFLRGPPLREQAAARAFTERFGVEVAPPVDFWTEAALFAEAGYPALVLGVGDIAEAHAADESVPLADLDRLTALYANVIGVALQVRPFEVDAGDHRPTPREHRQQEGGRAVPPPLRERRRAQVRRREGERPRRRRSRSTRSRRRSRSSRRSASCPSSCTAAPRRSIARSSSPASTRRACAGSAR